MNLTFWIVVCVVMTDIRETNSMLSKSFLFSGISYAADVSGRLVISLPTSRPADCIFSVNMFLKVPAFEMSNALGSDNYEDSYLTLKNAQVVALLRRLLIYFFIVMHVPGKPFFGHKLTKGNDITSRLCWRK